MLTPFLTSGTEPRTEFIFMSCQPGAEKALKTELGRTAPFLKMAYSRPGFITFKTDRPQGWGTDLPALPVFARTQGLCFGKLTTADGDWDLRMKLLRDWLSTWPVRPSLLHVWQRDETLPGDEPPGFVADAWIPRGRLNAATWLPPSDPGPLKEGDLVLDLIWVDTDELWIGAHRHQTERHSRFAGGKPRLELPAQAPSRAYLKLEEAVQTFALPLQKGDVAVEIGSAPGGASYALLERGLQVIGIDPGEMAPNVLKHPHFKHLRQSVVEITGRDLPPQVDWLLLDMNTEPRIALQQAERLAGYFPHSLSGLILTIKLNQWKFASDIPRWTQRVRALGAHGMSKVYVTQLASNRQEICICATSPLGERQKQRASSGTSNSTTRPILRRRSP